MRYHYVKIRSQLLISRSNIMNRINSDCMIETRLLRTELQCAMYLAKTLTFFLASGAIVL